MAAQILGQAVVLGEIARGRATQPELAFESAGGVLRDILVERARAVSRLEDPQNRVVGERSETGSMTERCIHILGGVALA